jgi:hypothetical protein
LPPLFVELPNQCSEPAIGQLAARRLQGLPDTCAVMKSIDVKGTSTFVQRNLAAAKPKKLATSEVTAEWV